MELQPQSKMVLGASVCSVRTETLQENMRFEVLAVVKMSIMVFWVSMPCSLMCLWLPVFLKNLYPEDGSDGSSETLITYQTTQHPTHKTTVNTRNQRTPWSRVLLEKILEENLVKLRIQLEGHMLHTDDNRIPLRASESKISNK
jgi:hypothetical protein